MPWMVLKLTKGFTAKSICHTAWLLVSHHSITPENLIGLTPTKSNSFVKAAFLKNCRIKVFTACSNLILLFIHLDPRKKYHVKLLAYNVDEDGYQADQTVSTPGCVCKFISILDVFTHVFCIQKCQQNLNELFLSAVRDRLVPPPPPPHNVHARTNTSTSVFLQWSRPAFSSSHAVNYTIRCNPVGLQNASLVLYLQT